MDRYKLPNLDELERLAILNEELGEAIHIISKILRHGYECYNPDKPLDGSNRMMLQDELGHVAASITLLIKAGDLRLSNIESSKARKFVSLTKYIRRKENLNLLKELQKSD